MDKWETKTKKQNKQTKTLNKQKVELFSPPILSMKCPVPTHPVHSMDNLVLNSYKNGTTVERCCAVSW